MSSGIQPVGLDSTQCSLPGCLPHERQTMEGQCKTGKKGRGVCKEGDYANRRVQSHRSSPEWRGYLHDKGADAAKCESVSKDEPKTHHLEHVMSAFGHCVCGNDSMKMWALQVAATTDEGKRPKQIDRQELGLRVAVIFAGIYAT